MASETTTWRSTASCRSSRTWRACSSRAEKPAMTFDILVTGGRIVDGSGNPWFRGEVGVVGGRIAAVGRLDGAAARQVLDAHNCMVSPGFIDAHSHVEIELFARPALEPKIRQGVTTEIAGQDG